jgi:hypothetical protein
LRRNHLDAARQLIAAVIVVKLSLEASGKALTRTQDVART